MKKLIILFTVFIFSCSASAQMFWNHAAKFEGGNNSYLAYVNSSSIGIPTNFTIECWVYPMSTGAVTRYLVFKQDGPSGASYYTGINSSNKLVVGTSPGITRIVSKSTLPLNKWTHIAAVFRNSFEIYINGVADTLGAASNQHAVLSPDSLFIGKHPSGAGFNGMMDNIRIWNRGLEPEEIKSLMRSTFTSTQNASVYPGLVLNLPFQRLNSTGTIFSISDLSFQTVGVNRGVTAVDLSNSPSHYLTPNESLDLTVNQSWATVPHNPLIDITGAMSLEAWVYMTSFTSGNAQLLVIKAPGLNPNTGYQMFISGNQRLSFGINNFRHEGSYIVPLAKWTHLAFTLSGTGYGKLYANGIMQDSLLVGMLPTSNSDSLYIGNKAGTGQYKGYVDEIRISKTEKTHTELKNYMLKSIDAANQPGGENISFNFDGSVFANTNNLQVFLLRGSAKFSNPSLSSDIPVSPLLRADNLNFTEGYFTKVSDRIIPLSGNMTDDSILVTYGASITDINLFLSLNHQKVQDLEITLVSPSGTSIIVLNNYIGATSSYSNVTTIFDDQTDSSLINNRYIDLGPRIKPLSGLSGFNGENSSGIWKLKIRDVTLNNSGKLNAWGIQVNNSTVGVQTISNEIPNEFKLEQNYPNPFNPVTNIKFTLPKSGFVKLKVYDILGKEVAVLVNKQLSAGSYHADFDAGRLSSGVYYYMLETNDFTEVKKMMLIK